MLIFPAIDIKGGQCVRLYKGDFATAEKVAEDPLKTALAFRAAGAVWLHTVDLDGALEGKRVNAAVFESLAKSSGLRIQLGGGIRDRETIEYYLEHGVSRVILGSAAVRDPDFVKEAVAAYGEKIAVGIDAKNGVAAASGWTEDSGISYLDLARRMEQAGVQTVIYTDIGRDGTLSGPNLEQLKAVNRAISCDIIASGGVAALSDIQALRSLGLYGAICGKALYKGTLSLKDAIREAG